jgi:hypothetical protein
VMVSDGNAAVPIGASSVDMGVVLSIREGCTAGSFVAIAACFPAVLSCQRRLDILGIYDAPTG